MTVNSRVVLSQMAALLDASGKATPHPKAHDERFGDSLMGYIREFRERGVLPKEVSYWMMHVAAHWGEDATDGEREVLTGLLIRLNEVYGPPA